MRVEDMYQVRQYLSRLELPLYTSTVAAGFPSPADDYIDLRLDLNQLLIKNPPATFFVRVSGDSMVGAGIHDGDLLVVDRSLDPDDGRIAVVVVNGECTVKRLRYKEDRLYLMPENAAYAPVIVNVDDLNDNYRVWGIVTNVIHSL